MDPDRWQRACRIYIAALTREELVRADFVRAACTGDDTLQRGVESLLAGVAAEHELLEQQATGLLPSPGRCLAAHRRASIASLLRSQTLRTRRIRRLLALVRKL